MTRQKKANLYAACAILFWSTVATAFKLTLRRVDCITLVFYASFVSALFLLLVLLVQGKTNLLVESILLRGRSHSGKIPGKKSKIPREKAQNENASSSESFSKTAGNSTRALGRSAVAGFLNPFLYYLILFKAYSLLPAQEAQPLNFAWPVVLSLLAVVVLREKLRVLSLVALLISFSGVVVISTRGDVLGFRFANPAGALLAIGSTFIWSSFWLMNMKDDRDEVLKLFLGFCFGFLYIFIARSVIAWTGLLEALNGIPLLDVPEAGVSNGEGIVLPRIAWAGLLGCVYVGLFEMGATFVLWLKALRLTESTAKVSNLIFLSPFLSLVFIHFVVGEDIMRSSVIGLALIVGGVILQSRLK
ncbi:MAG: EamA family transporter [Candidatus Latescibacteria bacterium]|nr:EamA family transporter [Candidatus Latescibacterota bacterium]NIO00954.1 EamA family transporter [Candidatus Latescibacterota bacterium]NIO27353.1 EamA family transporter [Candidatus Latescibacterota bacterium]NIO54875.1 EamA family transporter [Candidatus Latescibacterota bacterium]NIT00964.1 EamA family transporter [Candidatus Latescibacterota bacterium]